MEMTQDLIQSPDDEFDILQEDDLSCNVAEILDFCDGGELFTADAVRTSEVSSCSGGGGCDAPAAGVGTGNDTVGSGNNAENMCGPQEEVSFTSPFSPLSSMDISEFSALLDAQPLLDYAPDPIMSGCYQNPPSPMGGSAGGAQTSVAFTGQSLHQVDDQQDQFSQIDLVGAGINGFTAACLQDFSPPQLAILQQQQHHMSQMQMPQSTFAEDCMRSHLQGYPSLKHSPHQPMSCELMEPLGINMGVYFPGNMGMPMFSDNRQHFSDNLQLDSSDRGVPMMQEEYHADNMGGFYSMPGNHQQQTQGYSYGDMKQQPIVGGCTSPTTPVSELSNMEEPATYGQKISVEERKEKIHRYMKKRNERNFSKKIKYACRKTLADSRPRVRGRFAKNEEETRPSYHGQEDEDEHKVMVKEDPDSSDIFIHLNSFKCNFTLESFV